MAFASSPRAKGSPRKNQFEGSPIKGLVQVMESTRPEQWQKRTGALAGLIAQIPTGSEYSRREAWFNSPAALRHLHQPIGELLKDPRSTVVKRTCESLSQLFAICQGDAKYLFKDLMPVVLMVHAQTVQVIRNQVQAFVCETIPMVPCKMAMPLWLDRLKTDKSRTVREACVLYLGMGLKHWNIENPESGTPYLTEENWVLIGTALIKTLRDPSPTVRSYTKQGISTIQNSVPDLWDQLIRDPDGPAGKDLKLQKWLIKVSEEGEELSSPNNDGELSVASRYSHRSYASNTPKGVASTPTRVSTATASGFSAARPSSRDRTVSVPVSISVGGRQDKSQQQQQQQPARQMRGLSGPPLRRPFAQAVEPSSPPNNPFGASNNVSTIGYPVPVLGTPPRPPSGRPSNTIQRRSPSPSPRRPEPRHQVPIRSRSVSSGSIFSSETDKVETEDSAQSVASHNVNPNRNRARPLPEVMNGDHVVPPVDRVIDLVDASQVSPKHEEPLPQPLISPPEVEFSTAAYGHGSSAELLDVSKSIDQTLAHLEQPNPNIYFHPQLPQSPPYHPEPVLSPTMNPASQQQAQAPPFAATPEPEMVEEGPFIASMNELKQHASRRRSRRSIHMKERWIRGESTGRPPSPFATPIPATPGDAVSSLGASMVYPHQEDTSKPLPPTSALPEHYVIAEQLLRVHKTHVDQIMETLKIEMDALRDFELSLETEQSPSPDQVLDYFESVGLCLDQRTSAGNILQREMDRISKGAFTTHAAAHNHGI